MHLAHQTSCFIRLVLLSCFLFYPLTVTGETQSSANGTTSLKTDSFSFVVWGHPKGPLLEDPPLHVEEFIQRLKELQPDLLFVTGDAIEAMWKKKPNRKAIDAAWDRFDRIGTQLGIPVYISPGNHDVNNPVTRDIFIERYRKPPYAITYKGSRFIILDSVGMDPQSQGKPIYHPGKEGLTWSGGAIPFDEKQRTFIHREIENQSNFRHVFFFMHHTRPWSDPNGFWTKDIHPLLRGGTTRAVFSGNPILGKYGYRKKDGIVYIQSSTYPIFQPDWFVWHRDQPGISMHKEFDNFVFVQVDGEKVNYRPIVLGGIESLGLSEDYWDQVESLFRWNHHLEKLFHQTFYKLPHLLLLMVGLVLTGLLLGLLSNKLWRFRKT